MRSLAANRWELCWLLRTPSSASIQTVEMSPHEAFLLSSVPRVTFTAVVVIDRQRVGDGTSFGLVGFIPGVGSRGARKAASGQAS
jgi:hypothetical protein